MTALDVEAIVKDCRGIKSIASYHIYDRRCHDKQISTICYQRCSGTATFKPDHMQDQKEDLKLNRRVIALECRYLN